MRFALRPMVPAALCLVASTIFAMPALAGPSSEKNQESSKHKAKKPEHRGACEVGQVLKWTGRGWKCADDLVGTSGTGSGSGPQVEDASGGTVGPVIGTRQLAGATVPQILLTLADDPKPFLLAVDESGFVSEGRLFVQTTNEALTCEASCGLDIACLSSCITATDACQASNAVLEPPAPLSSLFRVGAVVGSVPATSQLWAATSTASQVVGECDDSGFVPVCATAVFDPATSACTVDIVIGTTPRQGYPAAPMGNVNALFPPPFALQP